MKKQNIKSEKKLKLAEAGIMLALVLGLTIFLGVYTHHRGHWHIDIHGHTAKATIEIHGIILQLQLSHRDRGNIQYDLALFNKLLRDLHTVSQRIDQDIGRAVILQNPLIECPNNIGTTGCHSH